MSARLKESQNAPGDIFSEAIEAVIMKNIEKFAGVIAEKLNAAGYQKKPDPQTFVAAQHLRALIGRRANSPMSHAVFKRDYVDTLRLSVASETLTGDSRQMYIMFYSIEKEFPQEIVEALKKYIKNPVKRRF